jgi:SAM-dependent methyltransferase
MKISGGLQEDGIVVGNAYDKYGSKNPVVRWMMKGFADALSSLVVKVKPETIHEIGCGEGFWVFDWHKQGISARGSDFSEKVIDLARENAKDRDVLPTLFTARSIYDIEKGRDSADLIVCCEVLEHLDQPDIGLAALQEVATDYVILSVPCEPLWRVLNLARGKYISNLGNTPGHIQHWSSSEFITLVGRYFDIVEVKNPLPWTMILCRVKH